MADSYSKIFLWQLVIAAAVGLIWFLLWEILSTEEVGFFFDLPWGLFVGFAYTAVVLAVLVGLVWTGVTMSRDSEGGFGGAMSANMDRLAGWSPLVMVYETLESWNRSGPITAIEWAYKVAFVWGVAGGHRLGVRAGLCAQDRRRPGLRPRRGAGHHGYGPGH